MTEGRTTSNAAAVADFFADQASTDKYRNLKALTEVFDRAAAQSLNTRLRGRVLAVGGLWDFFESSEHISDLTVVDLSAEMLVDYGGERAVLVNEDFFDVDFGDARFDTIVFPLMLHHVASGSWTECEERVRTAVARAGRVLAPDGQILIYEYCPAPWLRVAQRLALPITRRLLARGGQPLVVMHTRAFYRDALETAVGSSAVIPLDARLPQPWKLYPVFMSSRWLRIPIGWYPKPAVLSN